MPSASRPERDRVVVDPAGEVGLRRRAARGAGAGGAAAAAVERDRVAADAGDRQRRCRVPELAGSPACPPATSRSAVWGAGGAGGDVVEAEAGAGAGQLVPLRVHGPGFEFVDARDRRHGEVGQEGAGRLRVDDARAAFPEGRRAGSAPRTAWAGSPGTCAEVDVELVSACQASRRDRHADRRQQGERREDGEREAQRQAAITGRTPLPGCRSRSWRPARVRGRFRRRGRDGFARFRRGPVRLPPARFGRLAGCGFGELRVRASASVRAVGAGVVFDSAAAASRGPAISDDLALEPRVVRVCAPRPSGAGTSPPATQAAAPPGRCRRRRRRSSPPRRPRRRRRRRPPASAVASPPPPRAAGEVAEGVLGPLPERALAAAGTGARTAAAAGRGPVGRAASPGSGRRPAGARAVRRPRRPSPRRRRRRRAAAASRRSGCRPRCARPACGTAPGPRPGSG